MVATVVLVTVADADVLTTTVVVATSLAPITADNDVVTEPTTPEEATTIGFGFETTGFGVGLTTGFVITTGTGVRTGGDTTTSTVGVATGVDTVTDGAGFAAGSVTVGALTAAEAPLTNAIGADAGVPNSSTT